MPEGTQARQLAQQLSEQMETALTEMGLDASELYHMSRADQTALIEQVTNKTLSDQSVGELARLVEGTKKAETISDIVHTNLENAAKTGKISVDIKLVDELVQSGAKCQPANIVAIAKDSNHQIVWLEVGTESAGLQHIIIEHGAQFSQKGIATDELPDYIMEAVCHGKIVGYQGKKVPKRAIYEFVYKGEIHRIAISIGSNGFIIGANPRSIWRT